MLPFLQVFYLSIWVAYNPVEYELLSIWNISRNVNDATTSNPGGLGVKAKKRGIWKFLDIQNWSLSWKQLSYLRHHGGKSVLPMPVM